MEKRTRDYKKNGSKKMSKQGKGLILALLAFLIFFVGFKIYHSKDVQASTIKLVNKSNETYAYSGSKKLTGLQKINGNNYYFDSTTGVMKTGLMTLDGGMVYFSPQTGKMVYGLQKINGYYYYFTKKTGKDDVVKAYEAVASQLKSDNSVIEKTISSGMKLVGKSPYVYGGGRTDDSVAANEFDCSSFIAQMFRLGGQSLVYQFAASTSLLAQTGEAEDWSDKAHGDLLITSDDASEDEQHAAIYLGGGFILHDSTSTDGVSISRLNQVINKKVLGTMTWGQLFEPGHVRREV